MWRLLPIILLVSCAANESSETASGEDQANNYRIVNTRDIPLDLSATSGADQPLTKEFQQQDTRGWIRETGAWNISNAVVHTRLRCATYETGIQLGRGNPDCKNIEWQTDIDYGTRQTHCNSATMVHAGGGQFEDIKGILNSATCVRVVVRCTGPC